jgi:EmrB/QacA subfamily drug resistance transporter
VSSAERAGRGPLAGRRSDRERDRHAERTGGDPSQTYTLVATILGSSMAYVTAVNVALPAIGGALDVGLAGQQWVMLSYSLALASLYLVAGTFADRFGRRRTFVVGTVGFALASALAGAAPDATVLLVARVLQGVAGALVTTGSLSLLRSTFDEQQQGRAIGLWTAGTSAVSLAGPPLGGALVEWASWRWLFYVNVPLAVGAVALAWLGRRPEAAGPERSGSFDVIGAALVTVATGAFTYALVEAGEQRFDTLAWALPLAALAAAAFVVNERRVREPLLPLSLFRERDFVLVNVATLLVYSALAGSTFYLVLFLQSVIGYTAFEAGLLLVPSTVVLLVLAPRFGRLADRHGPRPYLVAGPTLTAVGMLLWLRVDDKSLWDGLLPGLVLFGLGLSMVVAPITAAALNVAPPEHAGLAAGANSMFSRLGSLFAIALLGLVVGLVFGARTDDPSASPLQVGEQPQDVLDASTDAFRAAMIAAAALALGGAFVAARFSGAPPEPEEAEEHDRVRLDPACPDFPAPLPVGEQEDRGQVLH